MKGMWAEAVLALGIWIAGFLDFWISVDTSTDAQGHFHKDSSTVDTCIVDTCTGILARGHFQHFTKQAPFIRQAPFTRQAP